MWRLHFGQPPFIARLTTVDIICSTQYSVPFLPHKILWPPPLELSQNFPFSPPAPQPQCFLPKWELSQPGVVYQ
ncbi:hypothetical protein CEXT_79461 [Caerostris extrusa]|uniref:Uncharacterized protein n=1 Tax=Caerostris extrusa TaxID=172846 RepID=A0AAV4VFU7_CAEEX|nr:hypothetical protein CEXT_79461 [Caerostris extrusa]